MNVRKVAEALDLLKEALLDGEDGADIMPITEPSRPRAKRVRRAPMLTRPDGEARPDVAAQAARILRERGFR